ncbi:MAG TPA: hypothetical protein VKY31_08180 [Terriglobia bacterium]|nr:hypothetical protein [Terriglobia bacterium]
MKAFVIQQDPKGMWKARPGCRVLVMDHGALRFDFPNDWIAGIDSKYVRIVDREPPEDRCSLLISCRQISAIIAGFPVRELLYEVTTEDSPDRPILQRGPITTIVRQPLEAAWRQMRFMDHRQREGACTRICIARGGRTLATIVFDFWAKDEIHFHEVWMTLMETLAVGDYIEDASTCRKREQRG